MANDGEGSFLCEIEAEPCKWLKLEMSSREVKDQEILKLICCLVSSGELSGGKSG